MKRAYSFQTLIYINVIFVFLFFTACKKEVKTDDSNPQGLVFSSDYSNAPTASYGVYGGTLPVSFFLNTPPPVSKGIHKLVPDLHLLMASWDITWEMVVQVQTIRRLGVQRLFTICAKFPPIVLMAVNYMLLMEKELYNS